MRYSISRVLFIFIVVFYCLKISAQHSTLIGQWTFEEGQELIDLSGNFKDLILHGSSVYDGQLHVDEYTWAHSSSYGGDTIRNKTLVAWVVLDEIAKFQSTTSGGSALTIDRISIDLFDGIVYAELEDDQWMLGSNYWNRTSTIGIHLGNQEIRKIVKIAFTQEALSDSRTINRFYLDGQFVQQYVKGNPSIYPPDDTEVLFGIRHLFPGYSVYSNKYMKAKIEEARIYAGILSQAEIKNLQIVKYNQEELDYTMNLSNKISLDQTWKKQSNFVFIKKANELFSILISPYDSIYQKLMNYNFQIEINSYSEGQKIISQLDIYKNQLPSNSEYLFFSELIKLNYYKNFMGLDSSHKKFYNHLFKKIFQWSSLHHKSTYLMILYSIDAEKSLKENELIKMIFSTEKSAEYALQLSFYDIAIKQYGKLFDIYYFNDNYELGISIARKVRNISDKIDDYYNRIHSRNNMGACFNHLNQLDSATIYFNDVKQLAMHNNDTTWLYLTDANLARIKYKRGDWEEAAAILKRVIDYNVSKLDYYPAAGEQIILCKIALEHKDIAEITPMINRAKILVHKSGIDKHKVDWYPILSKYYFMINDNDMGALYQEKSYAAMDSLKNNSHNLLIDGLNAKKELDFENLKHQENLLNIEVQNRTKQRNVIIVLLMCLLMGSIISARYFRHHRNKKISENKQMIYATNRQLAQSKEDLEHFKSIVHEKTEKLLAFETNVKNDDAKKLEALKKQIILTPEQWNDFKANFSEVHSNYISNIEVKHPNLTKSEIRYLVLSKISLSPDEMASITGVNVNTIHQSQSRIRKKMNINNHELQKIIREN